MPIFKAPIAAHTLSVGLESFSKYGIFAATVLFGFYLAREYPACSVNFGCYDIMGLTGFLTFAVAVFLSRGIRERFRELLQELVATGAIADRDAFESAVTRSVVRWCVILMILATGVVVAGFVWTGYAAKQQFLFTASIIAALIAGERYGRLVCYSRGTGLIVKAGGALKIDFWHPDNSGGLMPFSNFYLYSMFLAAIPALWLASWWLAIPNTTGVFGTRYEVWRLPYAAMWILVMLVALFSFVRPVFTIHRAMEQAKSDFLQPFDRVARKLEAFHEQFETADLDDARLYFGIEAMQRIYRDALTVSTWPIDAKVIGIFTGINVAQLLVPLWLNLIGGKIPDLAGAFQSFAEKLGGS